MAGYTTLVHEMDEVLSDLTEGKYTRVMVAQDEGIEGKPAKAKA